MIIGVVSLARGGKDTFADFLTEKYGYKKFNTSDVLAKALVDMGKDSSKDNMSLLGDQWRKESGRMDIVTMKALESINDEKDVVITGLRSKEEADLMRKKFPGSVLIGIVADKEKRYERRKPNDPQDRLGFFGRDERDIKNKGLGNVIMDSDYFLDNNSTLEDLYSNIENLLTILKEK